MTPPPPTGIVTDLLGCRVVELGVGIPAIVRGVSVAYTPGLTLPSVVLVVEFIDTGRLWYLRAEHCSVVRDPAGAS